MGRELLSRGPARSLTSAWPVLALFLLQRGLFLAVYSSAHASAGGDDWTSGLLRWDAGWYRLIAMDGYDQWPEPGPSDEPVQTNLAFFPLFPMAGRLLAALAHLDIGVALLVVAWIGSVVAAWGIFLVGSHLGGRRTGAALALAWGASPQAMVLVMGYPEGWLTASLAFTLFFLLTDRPVRAGLAATIAGLLQPASLPLVLIVMAWAATRAGQSARAHGWRAPGWRRYALGGLLAPVGLIGVVAWIATVTGRLLGYLDVQAGWGTEMGSPLTFLTTMHELVFPGDGGLLRQRALYAPIIIGYVVLLALLLGQLRTGVPRGVPWLVAYTVLAAVLVLANQEYFHSIPRHFLPVFTLLLPLARMRTNRLGAGLAIAVASVASAWWGANYVVLSSASI